MKKIIHIVLSMVAATVLATGCGEKIEHVPGESRGRAVGFACGDMKSRAQEATADNMTSFRVSAVWMKSAGDYVTNYMDGQVVEKNGNGDWTYSPIRYIPTYGTVDFFAYSPANTSVSDFKIGGVTHDQVSLTYDVTTDPLAQHDFMVAEALEQTSPSIFLDFRHVLSSLRIEARGSASTQNTWRIYDVKLLNLTRRGVLTGTTSYSPKATVWKWEADDDDPHQRSTYTIAQSGPVDVKNTYEPISDLAVGPLMLLPQTVKGGNKYDVVGAGDIGVGTGKFPSWMLGLPKDIGSSFYIAVTYEIFDNYGSVMGSSATTYISLSAPYDPEAKFTFEMGERYVFRLDLESSLTRSSGLPLSPGTCLAKLTVDTEGE